MYERLLDKTIAPAFEDLIAYSGERGELWLALDTHMRDVFMAQRQIRFPYGNHYGWSCKYSVKGKHICDVFAENGAFAVHGRMSDAQIASVYDRLSEYAQRVCGGKYPCGGGGWLTYRVLTKEQAGDAVKLLDAKVNWKG